MGMLIKLYDGLIIVLMLCLIALTLSIINSNDQEITFKMSKAGYVLTASIICVALGFKMYMVTKQLS